MPTKPISSDQVDQARRRIITLALIAMIIPLTVIIIAYLIFIQ